ncbi:MAG: PEP/pyruvate-binding domain-containing protein [Pseudomonadota bacterium]
MEEATLRSVRPWYLTFHDLMPYRVREILLVSSPYDAFTLEEDGQLTESIFTGYSELTLLSAPRITHVSTGARALELLAERRFDLVVSMVRIADMDVSAFGRMVKSRYPGMPVVLLVFAEADLCNFPGGGVDPTAVDRVLVWTGDSRILLSMIKLVEDARNVEHDTRTAGVRVIIVVEDSVRRYSSFLGMLYSELMEQSESLVAEGVNDLHRLLRMQTRPKVLLATTYEEAVACYERFLPYVVAVISDVGLPRNGQDDPEAGFRLVERMRTDDPELPILLQSAEPENANRAGQLGLHYVDKNSSTLLRQIRSFVTESLGFGDFVFRLPDHTEVARARDMYELERILPTLPSASLEYHATRNHFSLWLMARSAFGLAERIRPKRIEALGGIDGVRRYLLEVLREERIRGQEGVISDSAPVTGIADCNFLRLGSGSVGGKARGLAFVGSLLAREGLVDRFPGLLIRTPRTVAVGTDEFDRFVEANDIDRDADSETVLQQCLAGRLSGSLMRDLWNALSQLNGPIVVRSSSLLEDSQLQPFAGIYATYMLPNNHRDPEVRFQELCKAVRAVFASTYSEDARAYIAGTSYSLEEEKMAVIIQEMVGNAYGDRFYPTIAGVGLSYNYYPVGHQRAEDGLALLALGLGHTIVQGRTALQFSPAMPGALPQYSSPQELLRYSQSHFYALDLGRTTVDFRRDPDSSLRLHELEAAEQDGTLPLVASVYSREDDVIRDSLSLPGPRLVTFNNILKWDAIPLAPALAEILRLCSKKLGCPVEIEFAVQTDGWRASPSNGSSRRRTPCLYLLQVRPQATQLVDDIVETGDVAPEHVLCRTDRSLGHGVIEDIKDIVFVKRCDLECHETPRVAEQVGALNHRLQADRLPYLLIGPGRWGSSDPRLGIPVKWAQIAGARVIVETSFLDREVEPSQGAHFFHNVTSFRIGYLTISNTGRHSTESRRSLDFDWLKSLPTQYETSEVRHVRLPRPLRVYLDGKQSSAMILKP